MKRILTATFVVASFTFLSCSSDNNTADTDTNTDGELTTTAAVDSTLSENKQELMQTLAQHIMLQIELGKMVSQNATTDEAKQFAQQLVSQYTSKRTELQELASNYNITLESTLDDDQQEHLNDLADKKGADFDKQYWEEITDAQKDALDDYDDVLKDITEADATAFGIWARTSEKELRAQYEQALAHQLELKNRI